MLYTGNPAIIIMLSYPYYNPSNTGIDRKDMDDLTGQVRRRLWVGLGKVLVKVGISSAEVGWVEFD